MKNYLTDSREKLSSLRSLNDFYILSFESSCDETAVAVTKGREIVSNIISSQIEIHKRFGGVVPEIASRNHALQIDHLTREALDAAGIELKDVSAVAVTYGAGLLGALLVGVSYAKALAYAANLPLIAVNHIKGHVAANFISAPELEPPFIALLASGGHTYILSVKSMSDMEILGATLDDAVGEAFDKAARVLGLPYPGGPEIERAAKGGKPVYKLPRALKGEKRLDFSFSFVPDRSRRSACGQHRRSGQTHGNKDGGACGRRRSKHIAARNAFGARRKGRIRGPSSAQKTLHGQRGDDRSRGVRNDTGRRLPRSAFS